MFQQPQRPVGHSWGTAGAQLGYRRVCGSFLGCTTCSSAAVPKTRTGMGKHEPCMVACVTFLSMFSPSSSRMEQQTCPCCLKTTQPNPHIPPDTAGASHPLATPSTASPHCSQPPEHKVPRCAVAFTSGSQSSHCVHCSAPALKGFGSPSCQ